ncbi:efflux RND transporter periplasmic adaptor subunit [Xanthovirga aplysinae]|uniref:efflux RND transporter periplasmic adaptor subunit n=1 Tax=Xanthovirga aplysinae TaxID=2529853 RepID=UPI0012BBC30F|nr:efflux RND transporter periplasmic adaptor subunit [Xanthovirga aplysinae]MTI32456.1 efflux RND transporter periplasmic adaptor subunit [Xanthovirga aplysinae]
MNNRKPLIVLSVILILGGSFGLSNYFASLKEEPEKKEESKAIKYVNTQPVSYQEIPTVITSFGRVQGGETLDLIAEKPGKIARGTIKLKPGESFRKGNLLFSVDDTEARLNLQSLKSNFLKDLASILPDFKIDYANSFSEWESFFNAVEIEQPLPNLPKAKTAKEKTFLASRNIYGSYYNIKSLETSLEKHRVYAPFNGTIAEVSLQDGSFVNPGSRVARIVRTDLYELKIPIESRDAEWISIGKKVKVSTENGINEWDAQVSRIGEIINPKTQTLEVFLTITPGKNKIYDGLYLKAEIPGKPVTSSMEIPRNAVYNGANVFVVEKGQLQSKKITIHKINEHTLIFSGLQEGEDLVTEPLINAHNNMKVSKLSDKKAQEKTKDPSEKEI